VTRRNGNARNTHGYDVRLPARGCELPVRRAPVDARANGLDDDTREEKCPQTGMQTNGSSGQRHSCLVSLHMCRRARYLHATTRDGYRTAPAGDDDANKIPYRPILNTAREDFLGPRRLNKEKAAEAALKFANV
jgi:hypothetical protein